MLFYCCVPRGNDNEWPLLEHKMGPKKHHWQARGLGESVGADSSIKLWVMVHFIYVGFPRGAIVTRHLQPGENASTVRGHAASNGGRRVLGAGSESKISIGACIIPAHRHGSVVLLSLFADWLASRRRRLFEPGWSLVPGIIFQLHFDLI